VSLKERLSEETKDALRGGDKVRLATLRLLSAAVKNKEVEVGHELDDDEFVQVAQKEAKQRRESIEAFDKGGRQDLVAREREELEVLGTYVPAGLSSDEIDVMVEEAVAEVGASGPGDMGKVMSAVMGKVKGRADGREVQAKVRARLG
jgi:uncharacterized protein YqeY